MTRQGPAGSGPHRRRKVAWLAEQRRWMIEVFRTPNVHGFHQDADLRLAAAFQQAKATYSERTYII